MKLKTSPVFTLTCACALLCLSRGIAHAQTPLPEGAKLDIITLPGMSIYSQRVALQEPSAAAFAAPVSALAFEPHADVQSRNMAEAQADITIRGGIFENTGFRAGAAPLYDPQTGHYSAEIPIAPAMISAPVILTGAENSLGGWNATAGTIAYQWRRITTSGFATVAAGNYDTLRGELYQGYAAPASSRLLGRRLAFDIAAAWADSDGSQPWGESRLSRYNARLQLANDTGQTDLFIGRQNKFIAWPNLYTPYANIYETDDLRTTFITLNHYEKLPSAPGDYITIGGAWRQNDDHYIFNRADAGAYNPAFATSPSSHTTRVWSAGADALVSTNQIRWRMSAAFISDDLESTSLIYGHFNTRAYTHALIAPEREWLLADGRTLTVRAGVAYDDTNRDPSAWSPVASIEVRNIGKHITSLYISYAASSQVPNYTALNAKSTAGLFRGNPDLGRERSDNFETGARATFGAWTLNAGIFYRRDNDLVDWIYNASLPNARTASAVDINTLGTELTARFTASWGGLILGYTALSKNADYATGPAPANINSTTASFYALNYARHRLTAAIIARPWCNWEIRLDNEARLQEPNALRRSSDNALLTSAGIFYTPTISGWRGLRLFAQITNAWDSDFEDVPSVPATRRQWCAGVMSAW